MKNRKDGQSAPPLRERQIDDAVVARAFDDEAWEEPVHAEPSDTAEFSLPADLAARAAFLARVHHFTRLSEWLSQIVRERIELEENAFAAAKRAMAAPAVGRGSR